MPNVRANVWGESIAKIKHSTQKLGYLTLVFAVILLSTVGGYARASDALAYVDVHETEFGIVDLTTGGFTDIGRFGGFNPDNISSIASFNGKLYGIRNGTGELVAVDQATGNLSDIASTNLGGLVLGSDRSGLYGLSAKDTFYRIDPVTGAATEVHRGGPFLNVSDNGSVLYSTELTVQGSPVNGYLFTINLAAASGGDTAVPTGITEQLNAEVYERGKLYATGNASPGNIYQIDTTFGTSKLTASSTSIENAVSLAPDPLGRSGMMPGVPEPGAWALTLLGFGTLGAVLRGSRSASRPRQRAA